MTTAYLIHGYLGCGKTTFARRLESKHRAIRFSRDEWMAALYGADLSADRFAEFAERVSGAIEGSWSRCLELNIDVVLDLGFWPRTQRDKVRHRVTALGAHHQLHNVSCAEEIAWARVSQRNSNLQGSLYIARATFDALKRRFEPLGPDEPCINIAT